MTYQFRKAVRTNTSVLVGFAGPSGSGKTYSALRFAHGLAGQGKICVIDTEAGRSLHYADRFDFDHLDMKPPFSPTAYKEAIVAAEEQGYAVIVVDSMSHEWAGEGGCQDMHDEAFLKASSKESMNVLCWKEPKMQHKKMISRLLQSRAHLIFCLRAEEKIKFEKGKDGKMQIVPIGWMPICEKNFMYEMTCSFLFTDAKPGFGQPIKLQEQHKPFFNLQAPIDEKAGELLATWAHGGQAPAPVETKTKPRPAPPTPPTEDISPSSPPPPPSSSSSASFPDDLWLTALRKIDEVPEWAAVKNEVKRTLGIPDLRKVKPDKRDEVLAKIMNTGKQRGVIITV